MRRRGALTLALAGTLVVWGCDENLPVGPAQFRGVTLQVVGWADTLVIGDTRTVGARAVDAQNREIAGLGFRWTPIDTNIVALASPDTSSGRNPTLVPRRGGAITVRLALPDPRFVTSELTRPVTSVVAGVALATRRDTTLSAVGDTLVNVARALVRSGGGTASRNALGVEWRKQGPGAVRLVGAGDSTRAIALGNGTDTLIASHPFCLRGARCADTVFVRVTQSMALTLSSRTFQSWSFADSIAPTVTLADRRGTGQPGSVLRMVPRTAADSALVAVGPPIGSFDLATGRMPVPRLVTRGNGIARVRVEAVSAGGALLATDSVTLAVRQVAARVQAQPLRAAVTDGDSIPMLGAAYDARNQRIADATVTLAAVSVTLRGGRFVAESGDGLATGTVIPTLSGVALPGANPGAPAQAVAVDTALVSELPLGSVVAGSAAATVLVTPTVIGTRGTREAGRWIRFLPGAGGTILGATGDSAQTDALGEASVNWKATTVAGRATVAALLAGPVATPGDSAGRLLVRRSVLITPAAPSPATSTLAAPALVVSAAGTITVAVTVRDAFGNVVTNATPAVVTFAAPAGTFSLPTCIAGVCSATYTAPATVGAQIITATVGTSTTPLTPLTMNVIPHAALSSVGISGALPNVSVNTSRTVTVVLRDATGAAIANATAVHFSFLVAGGTTGPWACAAGTCTTTYTAPGGVGTATLLASVNGVAIVGSPINLTIVP